MPSLKLFYIFLSLSLVCSIKLLAQQSGDSVKAHQEQSLFSDKSYSEIPASAKNFFSNNPEQSLTVPLILKKGVGSDSYELIRSQLLRKEADLLESKSELETQLEIEGQFVDDEKEPNNSLAPSEIESSDYRVALKKKFSTGTSLSAEISHGDNKIAFETFPSSEFKKTLATLSVSQNLWKNSFGKQTKARIESGRLLEQATEAKTTDELLDWMEGLIGIFYDSWLAQQRVRLSEENILRKKRLLNITNLQVRRGTSESPDLLQVKRTVSVAEIQKRDSIDALESIWKSLVLNLDFPVEWLNIDPLKIPVKLDNPVAKSTLYCADQSWLNRLKSTSAKYLSVEKQKSALQSRVVAAKDAMKPQLDLSLSYSANGIDPDSRGTTVDETFSGENPAWSAGVKLTLPLDKFRERANLQRELSTFRQLSYQASSVESDLKVEWLNACNNLSSWRKKLTRLKGDQKSQRKRSSLEERRFRLGRGNLLNVIQAGDEVANVELEKSIAEVEVRKSAWKIIRLSGESSKVLKRLSEAPTTVKKEIESQ